MTLTPEKIQSLPAGDEMNAACVEAMGLESRQEFSTNLTLAMVLLNEFRYWNLAFAGGWYTATLITHGAREDVNARTASLAICRCFLLMKMKEAKR